MAPSFWHKKRGQDRFDWKRPPGPAWLERPPGSNPPDNGCMFREAKPEDALDFAELPWLNLLDKLALPMFNRVLLTGGLSTGKSTLLYQHAERLAKIGKKVLIILCHVEVHNMALMVDVCEGFKAHDSAKVFAIWSPSAKRRVPELLREHPDYNVFIEDTIQESIYDDGGVTLVKEWGAMILPTKYFWMVLRPFRRDVNIPKLEEAGFTIPRLQYGLGSSAKQLKKRLESMSEASGQTSLNVREYLDRRMQIKIPDWRGFGDPKDLDMRHCPLRFRPVTPVMERARLRILIDNYVKRIRIPRLPWPVSAEQSLIQNTIKSVRPLDWVFYFQMHLKLWAHKCGFKQLEKNTE